jgi:hypothetical protein
MSYRASPLKVDGKPDSNAGQNYCRAKNVNNNKPHEKT